MGSSLNLEKMRGDYGFLASTSMMVARKTVLCMCAFTILSCVLGDYTPADNYLIDCGSSTNSTVAGRVFAADNSGPATLTMPQNVVANISSKSVGTAIVNSTSVVTIDNSVLYQTARIFTGPSSYTFPIQKQGRHYIRLYFFPFVYQSYNLPAATFTVSTQDSILLKDFQCSSAVFKEFSANVTSSTLILSFIPSGSAGTAFISALEVVSVPNSLILDGAQIINPPGQYSGLSAQLLETVHRINNGGPKITPNNDTLSRTWFNDGSYLLDKSLSKSVNFQGTLQYSSGFATQETAPDAVYNTATELARSTSTANALFNVTWQFNVDASYTYLVRMHFCDIVSNSSNELLFNIYIGDLSAAQGFDLSSLTDSGLAVPYFTDFIFNSPTNKLKVSIGPSNLNNVLPDGILNGLEIMKLSESGSGIAVNPPASKKNIFIILGPVLAVIAAVLVAVAVFMVLRRRRLHRKHQSKTWMPFSINGLSHSVVSKFSNGTTIASGLNGGLGYRFSFSILQEATNNFDENGVIGVGGFGKVYKGVLGDETQTQVAVKRGNPKSQQGLNEFHTEIELLSRLRHRHLVSLIGYCDERNEMILVYEFMENGTLKSHLYGSEYPNLSWKQRLEICIGAARGLHYLHTGQAKAIIHRDVKSANILLDENLMAKVADFGLSKTGPELDQTHVSTAVKGSFGYLDPEYFRRQQLTEKSDVYSFGVVLLEVLCARPVIDPTLPREMVNLAEWGLKWQKRGELDQIVDARISTTIRPESLRKFGETVEKCLADYGVERPSLGDVLWNLEYALQLQEVDSSDNEVNSMNRIVELSSQVQNINTLDTVTVGVPGAATGTSNMQDSNDLSDVSMSRVFSQLIKAEGR